MPGANAREGFGVVGLGRIGGSPELHALERGLRVVGHARSGAPEEPIRAGLGGGA
jgi:hypothetical protein